MIYYQRYISEDFTQFRDLADEFWRHQYYVRYSVTARISWWKRFAIND